jgi:hypothetical protein
LCPLKNILVKVAGVAVFRKMNKLGTGTNHAPKSRNSGEYPVVSHQIFTPRSSVLLEKLTGSQLVKIFPTIYGTRRLITAFTSARSSPDTSGIILTVGEE